MSKPDTHFFIGPLTPAQQERRRRARYRWNEISEVMESRYCSFHEAISVLKWRHEHRFAPLLTERYQDA